MLFSEILLYFDIDCVGCTTPHFTQECRLSVSQSRSPQF